MPKVREGYCPYCRVKKLLDRLNAQTCGRDQCKLLNRRETALGLYYLKKKKKKKA